MEDFLPLLIGIIWLAYTLYNKGQKQKAKKALPGKEEKSPLSSILEEFLIEKEKNPIIPNFVEEPELKPFDDFSEVEKPVDVFQANDLKPVIESDLERYTTEGEHVFEVEEFENNDSYNTEKVSSDSEGFNLKQAVIYSEILNPPYI